METNEALRRTLMGRAETGIEKLVLSMQQVAEGNMQELEEQVLVQMLAMGRSCLEQVLEYQAHQQGSAARREGGCGHHQCLVKTRPRQILTLMGSITIHRAYYQCLRKNAPMQDQKERTCSHGEAPFDQQWGLSGQRSSPGLQKWVSYLAALLTQEGVAEAISRLLPIQMSARQVGNIMQPIGEAFGQWEEKQVQEIAQQSVEKRTSEAERQEAQGEAITRMYIEMDGVMARFRRGSVPMEKQEEERGGDTYREVKVGAVFAGKPGHERSELVPGVFVDTPGPIEYVARRTTVDECASQLYALAQRAGVVRAEQVVVIGDGAKWIWRLAAEQFPGAVQIVDEYHAREHVWEVARAAFAGEPAICDAWAKVVVEKLAEGRIEEVIAAIERLPPLPPAPGKSRSTPDIEADYFRMNQERMRYPSFRAQGMHVGSGIAEAACKTVVSARRKRSGMRWTPDGLDALLPLRTSVLNGTFDLLWQESRRAA